MATTSIERVPGSTGVYFLFPFSVYHKVNRVSTNRVKRRRKLELRPILFYNYVAPAFYRRDFNCIYNPFIISADDFQSRRFPSMSRFIYLSDLTTPSIISSAAILHFFRLASLVVAEDSISSLTRQTAQPSVIRNEGQQALAKRSGRIRAKKKKSGKNGM